MVVDNYWRSTDKGCTLNNQVNNAKLQLSRRMIYQPILLVQISKHGTK